MIIPFEVRRDPPGVFQTLRFLKKWIELEPCSSCIEREENHLTYHLIGMTFMDPQALLPVFITEEEASSLVTAKEG